MTDKSRKIFEELIFTNERTHNEWLDRDVADKILYKNIDRNTLNASTISS